jgi:virulence-associated protein VagC
MKSTTLIENNRTQAARVGGKDKALSPLDASWGSFFDNNETVPEDFLATPPQQPDSLREPL